MKTPSAYVRALCCVGRGYANLPPEDQEALRQLISRPGRNYLFISQLILSIPRGEVRDDQVMRQRRKPRALALLFPRTPEEIADEARQAVRPPPRKKSEHPWYGDPDDASDLPIYSVSTTR